MEFLGTIDCLHWAPSLVPLGPCLVAKTHRYHLLFSSSESARTRTHGEEIWSFHACSYSDICFSRHNGVSRIPSNLTNDPLQGYQPASDAQTCYSRRNILLPRSSERIIYISLPTTAIILFANFLTRQDSVKLTGWIQ